MPRLLGSLMILFLVASVPALAQQEPPSRVGRISFVSGNLAFHTPGQTEWTAAKVNYPVAAGTSLWTDAEARGEIRIGPMTIDMASTTELDVTVLDPKTTQLSIPQGRINLHLRQLGNGQSFEVDMPRGGVWLLQPGVYDIDAGTMDQPARVAVFEGSAHFVGGGADIGIKAGEVAVLTGFNPVTASLERAVADAFAEWCRSRDYDENRLASPYYVSPNTTGYVELDHYGRWDTAAGYGEVWYPNVPSGWVPYTAGSWAWIEPWGWTWVDAEPWGFAPMHYGRWALVADHWCWVPGAFEPYPVYAPALVAFLGGPGIGLYVSGAIGPQVGWFPLAPGEIYWPSYTSDPSYIRALNRANVANIDNVRMPRHGEISAALANRRFAVAAPQHVFAGGGRIDAAALHHGAQALEHARVTMRPPQIRPTAARALPGPAGFAARAQSGRLRAPLSGYGSSAGAMAARHLPGGFGAHAAAPSQATAAAHQRMPVEAGGRGPGRPEHALRAAAPQQFRAAQAYRQPAAHLPSFRAPAPVTHTPQHAFAGMAIPHAAPAPRGGGFAGGGHGPFGGGHGPFGGGHAPSIARMPGGGGGHAPQIAHAQGGGGGGHAGGGGGGGGGHGGGGHHG